MRMDGKVAIVTGAASGIGAATASAFAREGAKGVVVCDIDDERGATHAADIEKSGGRAMFLHLDVTNEAEWVAVIQETIARYGRLDVLVNNAGMSGPASRRKVEETDAEVWDALHAVNAKGAFLGSKHAIPEMRRSGGGSIINISSIYGIVGSRGGTAYHASKGSIRALTRATAIQYAGEKIRANSIHPGFVDSSMTRDLHAQPGVREERVALTPLGRIGTPEDIAYGCLYLASDESSWVTGLELVIDGGMLAQ